MYGSHTWWGTLACILVHNIYRNQRSTILFVHHYNWTLLLSRALKQLMINLLMISFHAHLGCFIDIIFILGNGWHHAQPLTLKKKSKCFRSSYIHFYSNGSDPGLVHCSHNNQAVATWLLKTWCKRFQTKIFLLSPEDSFLVRISASL